MHARLAASATLVLAIGFMAPAFGQSEEPKAIEAQALGWMKVYDFKDATAPFKADDRTYSARQLSIGRYFANWMQASYTPVGTLGDVRRVVLGKGTIYNPETAALPQSYGALVKLYTEVKRNAAGKLVPASNSHVMWSIMANEVAGFPAGSLNTAKRYLFTMPSFDEQGYGPELEKAVDLSQHPFLKQFPALFLRNGINGNRKVVILTRDGRLPFVEVTKGEYLAVIEAGISESYEAEKAKIARDNAGQPKALEVSMRYLDNQLAQRLARLAWHKQKYQARLDERAEIFMLQPDVMLENYPDVFEGHGGRGLRLPVYRVDPEVAERCKSDTPQWVTITWTADLSNPHSKHLHEAILRQFNFEYLYNFVFAPEKVAGVPYTPLQPRARP